MERGQYPHPRYWLESATLKFETGHFTGVGNETFW